MFPHTFCG